MDKEDMLWGNPIHPLDLNLSDFQEIHKEMLKYQKENEEKEEGIRKEVLVEFLSKKIPYLKISEIRKNISQFFTQDNISWQEFQQMLDSESNYREQLLNWYMYGIKSKRYVQEAKDLILKPSNRKTERIFNIEQMKEIQLQNRNLFVVLFDEGTISILNQEYKNIDEFKITSIFEHSDIMEKAIQKAQNIQNKMKKIKQSNNQNLKESDINLTLPQKFKQSNVIDYSDPNKVEFIQEDKGRKVSIQLNDIFIIEKKVDGKYVKDIEQLTYSYKDGILYDQDSYGENIKEKDQERVVLFLKKLCKQVFIQFNEIEDDTFRVLECEICQAQNKESKLIMTQSPYKRLCKGWYCMHCQQRQNLEAASMHCEEHYYDICLVCFQLGHRKKIFLDPIQSNLDIIQQHKKQLTNYQQKKVQKLNSQVSINLSNFNHINLEGTKIQKVYPNLQSKTSKNRSITQYEPHRTLKNSNLINKNSLNQTNQYTNIFENQNKNIIENKNNNSNINNSSILRQRNNNYSQSNNAKNLRINESPLQSPIKPTQRLHFQENAKQQKQIKNRFFQLHNKYEKSALNKTILALDQLKKVEQNLQDLNIINPEKLKKMIHLIEREQKKQKKQQFNINLEKINQNKYTLNSYQKESSPQTETQNQLITTNSNNYAGLNTSQILMTQKFSQRNKTEQRNSQNNQQEKFNKININNLNQSQIQIKNQNQLFSTQQNQKYILQQQSNLQNERLTSREDEKLSYTNQFQQITSTSSPSKNLETNNKIIAIIFLRFLRRLKLRANQKKLQQIKKFMSLEGQNKVHQNYINLYRTQMSLIWKTFQNIPPSQLSEFCEMINSMIQNKELDKINIQYLETIKQQFNANRKIDLEIGEIAKQERLKQKYKNQIEQKRRQNLLQQIFSQTHSDQQWLDVNPRNLKFKKPPNLPQRSYSLQQDNSRNGFRNDSQYSINNKNSKSYQNAIYVSKAKVHINEIDFDPSNQLLGIALNSNEVMIYHIYFEKVIDKVQFRVKKESVVQLNYIIQHFSFITNKVTKKKNLLLISQTKNQDKTQDIYTVKVYNYTYDIKNHQNFIYDKKELFTHQLMYDVDCSKFYDALGLVCINYKGGLQIIVNKSLENDNNNQNYFDVLLQDVYHNEDKHISWCCMTYHQKQDILVFGTLDSKLVFFNPSIKKLIACKKIGKSIQIIDIHINESQNQAIFFTQDKNIYIYDILRYELLQKFPFYYGNRFNVNVSLTYFSQKQEKIYACFNGMKYWDSYDDKSVSQYSNQMTILHKWRNQIKQQQKLRNEDPFQPKQNFKELKQNNLAQHYTNQETFQDMDVVINTKNQYLIYYKKMQVLKIFDKKKLTLQYSTIVNTDKEISYLTARPPLVIYATTDGCLYVQNIYTGLVYDVLEKYDNFPQYINNIHFLPENSEYFIACTTDQGYILWVSFNLNSQSNKNRKKIHKLTPAFNSKSKIISSDIQDQTLSVAGENSLLSIFNLQSCSKKHEINMKKYLNLKSQQQLPSYINKAQFDDSVYIVKIQYLQSENDIDQILNNQNIPTPSKILSMQPNNRNSIKPNQQKTILKKLQTSIMNQNEIHQNIINANKNPQILPKTTNNNPNKHILQTQTSEQITSNNLNRKFTSKKRFQEKEYIYCLMSSGHLVKINTTDCIILNHFKCQIDPDSSFINNVIDNQLYSINENGKISIYDNKQMQTQNNMGDDDGVWTESVSFYFNQENLENSYQQRQFQKDRVIKIFQVTKNHLIIFNDKSEVCVVDIKNQIVDIVPLIKNNKQLLDSRHSVNQQKRSITLQ